jgi:pyridoxamine 5'-phosphate oxidase
MDYRTLPSKLPADPLPYITSWLEWAADASGLRNPAAMALATADSAGASAVRMVLLKHVDSAGFGVFYTHYGSRKSVEIEQLGRGAGVLYWDGLGRQLRLEGPMVKSPASESDTYFASRPALSQLNAIVSEQSQPIDSAAELERRGAQVAAKHQLDVADPALQTEPGNLRRPAHWGGYRLWFDAVELWAEGRGRFHDRIRFERDLELKGPRAQLAGPWRATRLQP